MVLDLYPWYSCFPQPNWVRASKFPDINEQVTLPPATQFLWGRPRLREPNKSPLAFHVGQNTGRFPVPTRGPMDFKCPSFQLMETSRRVPPELEGTADSRWLHGFTVISSLEGLAGNPPVT